jgi:hypothetical protein
MLKVLLFSHIPPVFISQHLSINLVEEYIYIHYNLPPDLFLSALI